MNRPEVWHSPTSAWVAHAETANAASGTLALTEPA